MIEISGFTVKDDTNPNGEIEIITTGLRPGEKLYEELLIDAQTLNTPHPKIMRAKESSLDSKAMKKLMSRIELAISNSDPDLARQIITKWVEGYHCPEIDFI